MCQRELWLTDVQKNRLQKGESGFLLSHTVENASTGGRAGLRLQRPTGRPIFRGDDKWPGGELGDVQWRHLRVKRQRDARDGGGTGEDRNNSGASPIDGDRHRQFRSHGDAQATRVRGLRRADVFAGRSPSSNLVEWARSNT